MSRSQISRIQDILGERAAQLKAERVKLSKLERDHAKAKGRSECRRDAEDLRVSLPRQRRLVDELSAREESIRAEFAAALGSLPRQYPVLQPAPGPQGAMGPPPRPQPALGLPPSGLGFQAPQQYAGAGNSFGDLPLRGGPGSYPPQHAAPALRPSDLGYPMPQQYVDAEISRGDYAPQHGLLGSYPPPQQQQPVALMRRYEYPAAPAAQQGFQSSYEPHQPYHAASNFGDFRPQPQQRREPNPSYGYFSALDGQHGF